MVEARKEWDALEQMLTNQGDDVRARSFKKPVLLVFLRHFGCTFCREALADIAKKRTVIEQGGVEIVFVHMADNETAERYFTRYRLEGVVHVSDPTCAFYAAFGLVKANMTQLFGLQFWIRGFQAGLLDGHGAGQVIGDGFQMPGVFVIRDGEIIERFVHKLPSDRPDYSRLLDCCGVED
jgi:peroxiredoxin